MWGLPLASSVLVFSSRVYVAGQLVQLPNTFYLQLLRSVGTHNLILTNRAGVHSWHFLDCVGEFSVTYCQGRMCSLITADAHRGLYCRPLISKHPASLARKSSLCYLGRDYSDQTQTPELTWSRFKNHLISGLSLKVSCSFQEANHHLVRMAV